MADFLRRWRYQRYERRVAVTDDFADFEEWANGPWTPDIVTRMPWEVLIKGPQFGGIDPETRKVIELEIDRRYHARKNIWPNVMSLLSLVVAGIALWRTW